MELASKWAWNVYYWGLSRTAATLCAPIDFIPGALQGFVLTNIKTIDRRYCYVYVYPPTGATFQDITAFILLKKDINSDSFPYGFTVIDKELP